MTNDRLAWRGLLHVGWVLTVAACGGADMDTSPTGPSPSPMTPPADPAPATPTPTPTPSPTTPPPGTADGPRPLPPGMKFIALTQAQLNKIGAGNRQVDPRALTVFLGNRNRSCSNPFKLEEETYCGHWGVSFRLPPEYQREGSWHIEEEQFNSFMSFAGPPSQAPNCGGGAGSILFGELTIVEFGPKTLVVRLDDVRTLDVDMSGTYTVERCPETATSDSAAAR